MKYLIATAGTLIATAVGYAMPSKTITLLGITLVMIVIEFVFDFIYCCITQSVVSSHLLIRFVSRVALYTFIVSVAFLGTCVVGNYAVANGGCMLTIYLAFLGGTESIIRIPHGKNVKILAPFFKGLGAIFAPDLTKFDPMPKKHKSNTDKMEENP